MPPAPKNAKRYLRWLFLGLWLVLLTAWFVSLRRSGLSPAESAQRLVDDLRGQWWSLPAYVAVYAARPLFVFPASVLTIAGGILFGPIVGVLIVIVAANLSAMVAFLVGRTFSSEQQQTIGSSSLLSKWRKRLQEQSFVTVMVMRLAFLPYDLVNYASGFLRVNPMAFLAATAIGSLPGTVSFVLAGASVERIDEGLKGFDLRVFAASVALFVVSVAVAKAIQRHDATR